jgi:hypothetical protein
MTFWKKGNVILLVGDIINFFNFKEKTRGIAETMKIKELWDVGFEQLSANQAHYYLLMSGLKL